MKNVTLAMLVMASIAPLCGMAQQKVKVDVHTGANLSGFAGGKSYAAQDRKMKLGADIGVGVSYETSKKFVYASGIDFLLTAGGYTAMSDYLSNGNLTTAFPSVNSREVSVQIPVKFGYDFTLGEKLHFIPSVGAYGRFSMVSIKENVTENTDGKSGNSFKWNSFNNYQHNTNRLDGYKRWNVGGLIEGKFVYANRYAVTLGYSRGFLDKSPQFKFKNHSYHLTLGYTLQWLEPSHL